MSAESSSSYSSDSTMAFSKMAGFAVTPRMPSSSVMRSSPPSWINLRPIRSSHALCPNSFNLAAGFIGFSSLGVGARAFGQPAPDAGGNLGGREIVGIGERLLGGAGAEAVDADHQAVADDAVPVETARGFHRHQPGLAVRDELALLVAGPFQEALHAGHGDEPD